MVQDSKHALKTGRNQLLSSAHLGILGNYPLFYTQVRHLATSKTGPLYNRDVEKLDRQDDNAATRLFCAETLRWLTEHHNDQRGLIAYLFVIGEAVDAYQNRHISHGERIKMLFRSMFFMEGWEEFISKAKYRTSKNFISREYRDILKILVSGFIQLIVIHRDFLDDVYAFLPWLHSTEVCEHLFGIMRSILMDFTMLDVVYMVPKLLIRIREYILNTASPTGKARASGYNHTHADCDGVNLSLLSIFPSDEEINQFAVQAFEEAQNLLAVTGIIPSSMARSHVLPNINTWFFSSGDHEATGDEADMFERHGDPDDNEYNSDSKEQGDTGRLFDYIENEARESLSHTAVEQVEGLGYAAIVSSIGDSMHIHSLPEPSPDEIAQFYEDDRDLLADAVADCLPPPDVIIKASPANYVSTTFDFGLLVDLRSAHETRQAKKSCRTHQTTVPECASQKQEILRAFNAILKQNKEKRLGSGLHRQQYHGSLPSTAGNSANAKLAATARAKKAQKVRHSGFSRVLLPKPHDNILKDAGVTPFKELRCLENPSGPVDESSWAFVSVASRIYVARVLVCFQKGGGKNGRHGWILSTPDIHGLSNIGVQLFEYAYLRVFRAVHEADAHLQTRRHELIPARQLLTVLQKIPRPSLGADIEISEEDRTVFQLLEGKVSQIDLALKYINSRKADEHADID
ncbi:hypothetical protein BDM02DRAFT_3147722 [Thelephora ganbajun]|uniref:Uncharacterized protein n=1 Tax=Thelephora ganbajun TaxID=370292 RepID=A0ACB6Z9E4_THEGA|nr:hypothetical protein BDM02DRAFT_3147722 [Thelephora ganbajun]